MFLHRTALVKVPLTSPRFSRSAPYPMKTLAIFSGRVYSRQCCGQCAREGGRGVGSQSDRGWSRCCAALSRRPPASITKHPSMKGTRPPPVSYLSGPVLPPASAPMRPPAGRGLSPIKTRWVRRLPWHCPQSLRRCPISHTPTTTPCTGIGGRSQTGMSPALHPGV
jgi:hypothetical protein